MQQWALIRTTHAQQSEQNTLAVIHTCCNKSCQLQWLLIFKMNTRSYRRLRKGKLVVLGKVDCWIEQAKSFVTPEEGPPNGTSIPDRTTTRQDAIATTVLVATFRVVSTSCLPWPTHGVTVAWDSSDAAGLNTNSNYSSTSYHNQFVGRHLINKNAGKLRGGHQLESSRTNTTTIAKRPQTRCCIG